MAPDEKLEDDPGGRLTLTLHQHGTRVGLGVLALDVVSYSLEFDQVQERVVAILAELIQAAIQDIPPPLLATILPTGDGALIALEQGGAADAVDLAVRLRQAVDERLLRLPLRMGVHCGRATVIADPAGRRNYVGSVLNVAQRIMDLGDEGHLLLSESAAEELAHDAAHSRFVRPVSSNPVTVKHGVELDVYFYASPAVGLDSEPSRAHRSSEVVFSQLSRRATWQELFPSAPVIRAVDLSMPLLGTPALIDHLENVLKLGETEMRLVLVDPTSPVAFRRSASPAYKTNNELSTTIEYATKILKGLRFALAPYGQHVLDLFDVRMTESQPSFCGVLANCERSSKPTARERRKRQHVG